MDSWNRVQRNYSWELLHVIVVTCHVTSVLSMMTATFQVVTSPSGGSEWCSVDQPSAVIQMARGDMAQTCAMECLRNGCCMMCQFKANSYVCELFEYTSVNFSAIPSCSSQRITMRNGQPAVTQRDMATMLTLMKSPMYVTDRSNPLCLFQRPTYYIVSAMNNKVIDITSGGGFGYQVIVMPLQTRRPSQMWYFDAQGYLRSTVNNYAMDILNANYTCNGSSTRQLCSKDFYGIKQQMWQLDGPLNSTRLRNQAYAGDCLNICGASPADGAFAIGSACATANNYYWSFIPV